MRKQPQADEEEEEIKATSSIDEQLDGEFGSMIKIFRQLLREIFKLQISKQNGNGMNQH